jgi:cyclic pyranopterin phosphate synthase
MKNCLFSNEETDLLSALRIGQDIMPLIFQSVMHKKAVRAGMSTFAELADRDRHSDNRSMVAIGG